MRILAALVAMLPDGDAPSQITRRLHAAILFVLRPAESAVRRLIVVKARDLPQPQTSNFVVPTTGKRPPDVVFAPVNLGLARGGRKPASSEVFRMGENKSGNSAFPLTDPLKRFEHSATPKTRREACPNIWFPGSADRAVPTPKPTPHAEDLISAAPVMRRLKRLQHALQDIPGEAKRLMRSRARSRRVIALRPGAPPGHRKRHRHEVDDILSECQWLAHEELDGQRPPSAPA